MKEIILAVHTGSLKGPMCYFMRAQLRGTWNMEHGSTSVKTDICHYIAVSQVEAASYTILSKSGPF